MGALDRSYLLLVSPAGTGWVDQALIESAELLTRGDIATCVIQSGRMPSVLRWQQASAARRQFRAVLSGLTEHMSGLPPERRPKALLSGRPCRREYRADTARLVHAAFALPPVAEEQMQAVEHVLGKLALDRGSPRRPAGPEPAGPEPAGPELAGRWASGGASRERQADGHLGAVSRGARDFQVAVVGPGQLGDDGEADAAAGDRARVAAPPEALSDIGQLT
jgi:hypothetical protein